METITLIADRDAKSPVAEAYRTIRTNIQFSNVGQELKTIIVTSATPTEGKKYNDQQSGGGNGTGRAQSAFNGL